METTALPSRFSVVSSTSWVAGANAENSARTTYRPLSAISNVKLPSVSVAVTYLLPVRVFVAVTVTPGRLFPPELTAPRICPKDGVEEATYCPPGALEF
jgi:hypothetical protein